MIGKGKAPTEVIEQLKADPGPKFKWLFWGKDEIIFTPITRPLYTEIQEYLAKSRLEKTAETDIKEYVYEKIWDRCILWPSLTPEEKYKLPVGIMPQVTKTIQEKSGFMDVTIDGETIAETLTVSTLKDSEYWPKPTDAEKEELKKKFNIQLFLVKIRNWYFVVRPMSRTDLRVSRESVDQVTTLCRCVTVWPKTVDWDILPMGIVDMLNRKIEDLAGWTNDAECEPL